MKILGLFRHAKSEWDDTAQRDFDRGINERGRRGAEVMGPYIRNHGINWGALIASPAVRVTQTLERALPEMHTIYDPRLYLASSETILEAVEAHGGDHAAVLIAGHNPGLQDVILDLVSPSRENELFREAVVKFPTASFAVLECAIERWSELRKHTATLVHFARPRDLDPALAPLA
jgi:phosphohistidine phosphatase